MRAVALHADVLLATSAVLQANCVIVRGRAARPDPEPGPLHVIAPDDGPGDETFVIDSPILPEELSALGTLVQQARFPAPSGLLATHGDWDHLLGRLAFPDLALGCAHDTAERLQSSPGEAQRELRSFDEELMIDRDRPLSLGALQELPVPGRCELGAQELELHPAPGHTRDGMAVMAGWAGVLICGDYLSTAEIPSLGDGGGAEEYTRTLERLRPLVARSGHVVPGHGPVLGRERALEVLEEDLSYVRSLRERGEAAELPRGRRSRAQRRLHAANAAALI